jgi:RNase H-fold protein (predicted Holliday junction resolvase)
MNAKGQLLAIDPGAVKCGIAILNMEDGQSLLQEIITWDKFAQALIVFRDRFMLTGIAIGNGTTHKQYLPIIAQIFEVRSELLPPLLIDEKNSTLEAREVYLQDNPPKFPWYLLPRGLILTPRALDHYAAVVIGRRCLNNLSRD